MRIFDAAVLAFLLFGVLAAGSLFALAKASWRRRAWLGLKVGLAGFLVAMGIAMATSPPKDVLEAEAAARTARIEQVAREKAEMSAAEAAAKEVQRAQAEREQTEKAAAVAEAKRAAESEAAKKRAEEQKRSEAETAALLAPKPMKRDAIGCVSREANDRLTKIAVSGDKVAFTKLATSLIATAQCRPMKEGTLLHLEDTAIFSGLMCGRPAGETRCYWLPIEITK